MLTAACELDLRPLLASIDCPALVMHSTGDRLIRVGNGRFLSANLRHARLVELDGDEHWFWTGDVARMHAAIDEFVAAPGARPRRAA